MSTQRSFSPSGLLGLSMIVLLAGCAVGPDYKRPDIQLPATYPDAAHGGGATKGEQGRLSADWWTLYNDKTLDGLVASALKNNTDLHRAVAQIDAAEAVLAQANSTLFPEIDLGASSSRSHSSTLNATPVFSGVPITYNANRLALSTSFELDFWGKLRRASQAAHAQVLSSRYARDVVALTVAGATTQSYFTLRSLDAQITVTEKILRSREDSLAVIKDRAKGGLASELDVNQAQVARSDAAVQLRDLKRQRALMEHQLGVLTGKLDLRIAAGDIMNLPMPSLPPVGLPSTLLERRPDVQQAEQALVAANAEIGFNKASQFPSFSLTGDFGGQSAKLSNILKSGARIWSLGLEGLMPIFSAGKYAARTREAVAVQRQAVAAYEKTVQTAFKDVADALTNVEQTRDAAADIKSRVEAARNVLRLSHLRYDAGYSPYLNVLDAERTANSAEQALVQNRQQQLIYSVDLMKALGGGWSPNQATPVARR
ncbi:MAG: efflux transporter outer membrane subunit [Gammaproteobacteria bacterium]|jgi:multidrug efflux system outer membrane protein